MQRGLTGHFVPLPPSPALELATELWEHIQNAMLDLGRLDGLTIVPPDPALFLYPYIRKEAVLSSQIEGSQSSLSDLMLFELDGVPACPWTTCGRSPTTSPR